MKIPLSNVVLDGGNERKYAAQALADGQISGTGPFVKQFEAELGKRIGQQHVVATANGTVALELALKALGIGPGDEVIVPALTFVAPAAAVKSVGALPVFADVTEESWTIDPAEVARLITDNTRAVIAVDLLGHPHHFEALHSAISDACYHRPYLIPVIEDAAEAHGAFYINPAEKESTFRRLPVGAIGDIATFSFHANKAITTGEGGCVTTFSKVLADKVRLLANHGMTKDRPYWHEVVGTNARMTNMQAAIGLGQAERWTMLTEARRHVARQYDRRLKPLFASGDLTRRPVATWAEESCWLYTVAARTPDDRTRYLAALHAQDIDARAIWTALPDLPIYRDSVRGDKESSYPVARRIANTAFWLPTWAGMPYHAIDAVVAAMKEALPVAA